MSRALLFPGISILAAPAFAEPTKGLYRFPALHGQNVVFAAEGDLWSVTIEGGLAQRLTTHPGDERYPAISGDGMTLAFRRVTKVRRSFIRCPFEVDFRVARLTKQSPP